MSEVLEFRSPCVGALKDIGLTGLPGVNVRERAPQIATIIARGPIGEFAQRLKEAFGVELTLGSKMSSGGGLILVATGPRAWLAVREGGDNLVNALRQGLGETAAITDQSSGYAVLRIAGPNARATFEKGLGVDLHPRAFQAGDAASTSCAHLNVVIWQIDDAPTYDVAVPRSFAAAFCHWLSESAAEFGLKVLV
ncbi:MAG: sarcosine oxidase subunit gamma family protein [Methylovirgula sp.]|uniref:sarcosine oxidase subunit gamma n=1 Tax=Methylovirgula sp. TaxID=1978224 RepID=UPI00307662FC